MENFDYSGNELRVFSSAKNWKAYWTQEIKPFLGDCILEVGAGIGATAAALNFRTYRKWVALEPDEKLCSVIRGEIARGALPADLEVRTGTSRALSPDETFDTILYIDVLEHIEDDARELVKAAQHLQKDGCLVIVAPAHNFLYSEFDRKIGHFRRYDKGMLRSVIPEGLEIRRLRYLDSVGLLASLANRMLLRSDSPTHGQVQLWDRFMVRSSRWLDPLFGHGLGKSIVCVLKKPQGGRGSGEIS